MTPRDTVNRDKLPVARRRRRGFGAVDRLPSGRFRARVLGPDGPSVSAPATFATRTDAAVWVDLQRADLVRGLWKPPARRRGSATVGDYIQQWIIQHPSARSSTKELYAGLLRTCIAPDLGRCPVAELTPERSGAGISSWGSGWPPTRTGAASSCGPGAGTALPFR